MKQLREAVLDPSARIADGYQTAKVTTAAGESVEGVARNYNNYSIQMLDRSGHLRIFSTHELKAASFPNQSLMPKISLTPDELQNLIAFLSVQAVRK